MRTIAIISAILVATNALKITTDANRESSDTWCNSEYNWDKCTSSKMKRDCKSFCKTGWGLVGKVCDFQIKATSKQVTCWKP